MIETFIVLPIAVLLIGLAVRANARFRSEARLPMQWSLAGQVNWTAPRRLALALIPALGIVILTGTAVAMFRTTPRPGQEGLEAPILLVMGLVLVGAQLLHLKLIARTLGDGSAR